MRLLPIALALGLLACGDDAAIPDAAVPDATTDATAAGDAGALPDHVRATEHAANIVDAEAADQVRRFLSIDPEEDLSVAGRAFFDVFGDDYDFLYLVTAEDLSGAGAVPGRFRSVRRPAMPGAGLPAAFEDESFGSPERLLGVIGMNRNPSGNGPTGHETLHHWAVFLDASFGFGRDRDQSWGNHWGPVSVHGQHGGFDADSLRCVSPEGARPPGCAAEPSGRTLFAMDGFNPNQNGGDGLAYAPMELYLMGLLPAAEVPDPILVLQEASFVSYDMATDTIVLEADGVAEVSMADIQAVHGPRAMRSESERAFRGAFVVFSDAPVSDEVMDVVDRWSRVFGGVVDGGIVQSFEELTGGRATMDTRLGAGR